MTVSETCRIAKANVQAIAHSSEECKNRMLLLAADALTAHSREILAANAKDLSHFSRGEQLRDRLLLNDERIAAMAEGLRQLCGLSCPVGEVIEQFTLKNGLNIERVRVPFGVVGIIYEARPNVTADAIGLCIKSGNAVVLRGSKDAFFSNSAIVNVIKESVKQAGVSADFIQLIEDVSREGAREFMCAKSMIDVLIPRGSASLIQSTVENATVPVIQTGSGNCHIYLEQSAEIQKAIPILINAKTQRTSVCNAAESLVIDQTFAEKYLPEIVSRLQSCGVEILGDERARKICNEIIPAEEEDFDREYLALKISIKIVNGIDEAIPFINLHSTGHSESIITEHREHAERFLREIDSACVYWNASTRFTDGFEFGFGAEMGISTQKLHARGPMGLRELTTYKFLIRGSGQIRK